MDRRLPLADEAQGATFVELFFDLVFVFAVTQLTATLREDLTVTNLVRVVVVSWLVWWAWTQFTWTLNAADTEYVGVELLTMAGLAAAFVMAVAVPDIFTEAGWWFATSYVAVRVLGLVGQWWIAADDPGWATSVRRWSLLSAVGLVAVLVAAAVPSDVRLAVLAVAMAIDLVAAWRAGSGDWGLYPAHFAERHGLFVIIVLGESLIAAGIGAAEIPRTATLLGVVLPAVVAACALWWTYFAWPREALESAMHRLPASEHGRFARDVYSFLHFPVVVGVVGFAVGVEEAVAHPDEHLHLEVAAAMTIGVALVLAATGAALWRSGRRPPLVRGVACVAVLAATPLLVAVDAVVALTVVATLVTVVAVVEHRTVVASSEEPLVQA